MIKFFGTSLKKGNAINPCVDQFYFNKLNELCKESLQRVFRVEDCDVVFIPFTYKGGFPFDYPLAKKIADLNKPIVVFDFIAPYQIFAGVKGIECFGDKKYGELYNFLNSQMKNIKLYFKKELFVNEDLTKIPFTVKPIEFINTLPKYITHTKKEFNKRLIDIYMVWSFSSRSRALLHGELVKYSAIDGRWNLICDHSYLLKDKNPGKIALIFTPPSKRITLKALMDYQNQTKISISAAGSAQKCHRHLESPWNSIMAMQDTNLVWTYPWIDGKNCIILPVLEKKENANIWSNCMIDEAASVQKIKMYLKQPDKLYAIYLEGIKSALNYQIVNYIPKYVAKEILEALK